MYGLFSILFFTVLGYCNGADAALPENYQSLSATTKQGILWKNIEDTQYSHLPTQDPSFFKLLNLFSKHFLQPTFFHSSDEMPENRPRTIHPYGSVAKVLFKPNRTMHPFTGLFKTGGIGLIRLSLALESKAYTPGVGLKILIDHHPSVNFQLLHSLDGQGNNHNFFAHPMMNIIDPPKNPFLKIVELAFKRAVRSLSRDPLKRPENERNLPLFESAKITSSGKLESEPVTPFLIILIPNLTIDPKTPNDFRYELSQIEPGTEIYQVALKHTQDSPMIIVGSLITQSPFIASEYGDRKLFFQHQRLRE